MPKKMPYLKFDTADFFTSLKVRIMSVDAQKTYAFMLLLAHVEGGSLPADAANEDTLGTLPEDFDKVLACFHEQDGRLHNARLDVEISDYASKCERNKANAKARHAKESERLRVASDRKRPQATASGSQYKEMEMEMEMEKKKEYSIPNRRPDRGVDVSTFQTWWNALASEQGLTPITKLTESRKTALRARLRDYPDFRSVVTDAVRARAPDNGDFVSKKWLTFDFIITPKSLQKLLEGNYAKHHKGLSPEQMRELGF